MPTSKWETVIEKVTETHEANVGMGKHSSVPAWAGWTEYSGVS